jgi:hypothetical protein
MRRIPLIVAYILILCMIVKDIYEFFVTNEGIRYYSEPRRIFYVLVLGVIGGTTAFGISRISKRSQRNLKLTVLGTFGVFLAVAAGFFAVQLSKVATVLPELGMLWMGLIAGFALMAGIVGLEFRSVWRQR